MTCTVITGDVRDMLPTIPPKSVQCVVTSPPYYGLRDYGVPGQIGLEPTLAEYISGMVDVFRLVRDVLADDGTVWLNIGDSYHTDSPVRKASSEAFSKEWDLTQTASRGGLRKSAAKSGTFKNKDLMMVPARLAIALQDDGWYLRSDIIWHKPNPMPESVTDRPTSAHEHIFLLTKSPRYYWDAEAIAEPVTDTSIARLTQPTLNEQVGSTRANGGAKTNGTMKAVGTLTTRNCRNVWSIATAPYSGAHFATFPPEIPRRCILAGTSEKGQCPACGKPWVRVTERSEPSLYSTQEYRIDGAGRRTGSAPDGSYRGIGHGSSQTTGWQPSCPCDAGDPVPQTVLDIFAGAGTTLMVADRLGRNAIGIELNPEYAQMARKRIYNDAPLFQEVPA